MGKKTLEYSLENLTNQSNPMIENLFSGRDENLAKIEIATLVIIFSLTIIGNSIVLSALWLKHKRIGRKKLPRMYFFILHLSIADLITAFLSVLPQLAWDITYRFFGGFLLCKIIKYGQLLGPYLSSYILMATAIDRYQAICYPLTYCSWTYRRSKTMVYLAWMASLILCLPQLAIFTYEEVENDVFDCWATFQEPWGEKAYVTWYSVSVFIIPLMVLVVTYTTICREIWHNSKSTLGHRNSTNEQGKNKQIPLISRAKVNTIKQTIAVIVINIICSSPFILAQLWATWEPHNIFSNSTVFVILALLYSLNSCVNPWIYLGFNRELFHLLFKHNMNNSKNCRTAGDSVSNSLTDEQNTTEQAFSRRSSCKSFRTNTRYSLKNDEYTTYCPNKE